MFIPITMLVGFLTGVLGFFSTVLATPFAYVAYGLLAYELKIVDVFASLSFSSFHISYFPAWVMVLVYLSYFIFLRNKKQPV